MDLPCRKDRGHAYVIFCNKFQFKRTLQFVLPTYLSNETHT
jgi:recombinational DNA repair protein RecT